MRCACRNSYSSIRGAWLSPKFSFVDNPTVSAPSAARHRPRPTTAFATPLPNAQLYLRRKPAHTEGLALS